MNISTNIKDELDEAKELLQTLDILELRTAEYKTSLKFLSMEDVCELTGYSMPTVQKLFKRKDFPSWEIGKQKLVFAPAFYEYAMKGVK